MDSRAGERIGASVGRDGVNRGADVLVVRRLLNRHIERLAPLAPLPESEEHDVSLELAICEFQRRVVGIAKPDGRVDPEGRTLRALRGEHRSTRPSFVQLPDAGHGWYAYTSAAKCWGTPATLASVRNLAERIFAELGVEIDVGNIDDTEIKGVRWWKGHDNHLHVRFHQ